MHGIVDSCEYGSNSQYIITHLWEVKFRTVPESSRTYWVT